MSSAFPPSALEDAVTEVDEMYQNAGEKGDLHPEPDDPPRRRANKRRGHGTFDNDRPPVVGGVGRESGQLHLAVVEHADRTTLQGFVETYTRAEATVNTDEWRAYDGVAATGRAHPTVNHTPPQREWARDDDGDGVREVHINTLEGLWTGLRNFLRPFRGVHKRYLSQYTAVFEWMHNVKRLTLDFLRSIMLLFTSQPS